MEDFIKNLRENIDLLEDVELSSESNLLEVDGWDSISLLSTMAMIASEYGVTIKGVDIANTKSVAELFELIKSKM